MGSYWIRLEWISLSTHHLDGYLDHNVIVMRAWELDQYLEWISFQC